MNKFLKTGLILQIPNLIGLIIFIFAWIFMVINWEWLLNNIILIIIISIFTIINIFSIILLALGILDAYGK